MAIINLTQHPATAEQVSAGVADLPTEARAELCDLLTFDAAPTRGQMFNRALKLAALVQQQGATKAMIGGAPFFMGTLQDTLKLRGIAPVYAFSQRESVEKEVEGKIVKTNVFKHVGFVEV